MRPVVQVAFYFAGCAAAALLAGCGAGQPATTLPHTVLESRPHFSLMPGTREVQYFSSVYSGLLEYDYPKSTSSIGSINFSGGEECTQGAKTFWVVAFDEVAEFKVGGSVPIRTLPLSTQSPPSSCAVDAGGDIAVGLFFGSDGGDVVVFKKAKGSGTAYTTPLARALLRRLRC